MTLVVNVFDEVFTLKRYTGGSKRVNMNVNIVISGIQMEMICDIPVTFGKWNSHANTQ